ncbi:MAG: hypothetical protein NTX28_09685 [Novosphingobium sp.]|nr:hypothetical protein [Novosphingobium sp.]
MQPVPPERLRALADWCEGLAANEQRQGFRQVLGELDLGAGAGPAARDAAAQWIALLADSGAFESAAVAIVPRSAAYTSGRLTADLCVAHVTLQGRSDGHSGSAKSFSMALLAALLRALSAEKVEADEPCVQ